MNCPSIIASLEEKKSQANSLFKSGKFGEARDCEEYAECIRLTDKAIDIDPGNVKAIFRKAQALDKLLEFDQALKTILQLLNIEPANAQAKLFEAAVRKKIAVVPEYTPPSCDCPQDSFNSSHPDVEQATRASPLPATFSPSAEADGGYGFMNPHWTPGPSVVSDAGLPSYSASDAAKDAMAENEKSRLKNELFASALKSKLNSGREDEGSSSTVSGFSSTPDTGGKQLSVGIQVQNTLEELTLEEDHVVDQMKAKAKQLRGRTQGKVRAVDDASRRTKKASAEKGVAASMSTKRVISDRARDEWASLIDDENDIKKRAAAKLSYLTVKK